MEEEKEEEKRARRTREKRSSAGPRGNYKIAKINHKTRLAYRRYHKASRTTGRSAHIFGVYDQSRGQHAENVERYMRFPPLARVRPARVDSPRGKKIARRFCTAIRNAAVKRLPFFHPFPALLPLHPSSPLCPVSRPVRIYLSAFLPIIPPASPATLLLSVNMNPSDGMTREFALNHIFHVVSRSNVLNIVRQRALKDYPKTVGFHVWPRRIYLRLFANEIYTASLIVASCIGINKARSRTPRPIKQSNFSIICGHVLRRNNYFYHRGNIALARHNYLSLFRTTLVHKTDDTGA